jgi:hypothetical protein
MQPSARCRASPSRPRPCFEGLFRAILFVLTGAATAAAQEVIHRYDSLVQVARDGTLTVTETISVRAEGREIKRGIYRDFPLTFQDAEGRRRVVTFKLLGVTRDGKPEPHFTRRSSNGIRIYAGEESVLLSRGDYVYTFTYETDRQIRWFDGAAELFWNVTGNEWAFPIERARVRVELPGGARPDKWTAYTGRFGARGTAWRGDIASNGALEVETTQRLARNEGLSVVVAIPEGAVDTPSDAQLLWYSFSTIALDSGGAGTRRPARLLRLCVECRRPRPEARDDYSALSSARGRFARARQLRSQLGAWPQFVARVHRCRTFASRAGLVLFDEKDGNLTLRTSNRGAGRVKEPLPPGEHAILSWLTQRGGVAAIDKTNGSAVATVGKSFRESIEKENKNKFSGKSRLFFCRPCAYRRRYHRCVRFRRNAG